MTTNQVNYSHGDTGTAPSDGFDFASGQKADPQIHDWFWDTIPSRLDSTIKDTNDILNGNTTVPSATDATNVTGTYKGNDIDSDGDGIVDEANDADTVDGFEATDLQGGGGGFNLMNVDIGTGQYSTLTTLASGTFTTLEVEATSIAQHPDDLSTVNTPSGLQIIVRDVTNGTNLATFGPGTSQPNTSVSIGGVDVAIIADNGAFGTGTGSNQQNVNGFLQGTLS